MPRCGNTSGPGNRKEEIYRDGNSSSKLMTYRPCPVQVTGLVTEAVTEVKTGAVTDVVTAAVTAKMSPEVTPAMTAEVTRKTHNFGTGCSMYAHREFLRA